MRGGEAVLGAGVGDSQLHRQLRDQRALEILESRVKRSRVELENDRVELENDRVELENDRVELENDRVELENKVARMKDECCRKLRSLESANATLSARADQETAAATLANARASALELELLKVRERDYAKSVFASTPKTSKDLDGRRWQRSPKGDYILKEIAALAHAVGFERLSLLIAVCARYVLDDLASRTILPETPPNLIALVTPSP
ncbi:MAG: hypothetical protein AAF368_20290, partial [Planctomycetota bacterium]